MLYMLWSIENYNLYENVRYEINVSRQFLDIVRSGPDQCRTIIEVTPYVFSV